MGLFDFIFRPSATKVSGQYFKTLTAYQPTFTNWRGQLYESELVRSAIHAKAKHISKLKVEIRGAAQPKLQTLLKHRPNTWQTWGQFLYRLDTILEMQNTAFIVPIEDRFGNTTGVFPILPSRCQIIEHNGTQWLKYTFDTGAQATIEMARCGVMTKFQYEDDFFGSDNLALNPTLELMHIQKQGIKEAVKSSATFRFMAKLNNFATPDDIAKEQVRFTENNLKKDSGGILLFPNTYQEIQQIKGSPYVVDKDQMDLIRTNVFDYFGVNEDIIQNKSFGDAWSAFYEGEIEPFAIQFSEVITKMLFTNREVTSGSCVIATANRLQYMSNADKLQVSAQMADRGLMSINEIRDIWNLAPIENGDRFIVRGEYYNADKTEGSNNDRTDEEEAE